MSIVYLNGQYLPIEAAHVSVLDRGFIFGDGVYEVIPVFGSHVLRLREHLERLRGSLEAIYMENPLDEAAWGAVVSELLRRNPGARDRSIYLQITRGTGPRSHAITGAFQPTVFASCSDIPQRNLAGGVSAILHEDIRWQYCNIKSICLLPNVILRERARREGGAIEAILIRDGSLTEGAASNVFVVKGGCIRTPAKGSKLLPGITRDLVVELLRRNGARCVEEEITRGSLVSADEIWLTSSTMGIAPVVELDGEPVGTGKPGPAWQQAEALYQQYKANPPPSD